MKSLIALAGFIAVIILISGCITQCPSCICPRCDAQICPGTQVQKETKYVCPDDRIVTDPYDCRAQPVNFVPITTNERGTEILEVTIEPSCVKGNSGGLVHYNLSNLPYNITVQVKEQDQYKDVFTAPNVYDGYTDFVFCEKKCPWPGAFKLEAGKVYLMRVAFQFNGVRGIQYSNEHIVDARSSSNYSTNVCMETPTTN